MPSDIPSDGGPVYAETDLQRRIAEPYNAASALVFVVLVVFWAWRLRGQYRQQAFLTGCLPLLFVGGIGGTLYHAFRRSYFLYLLDVVPITLLAVTVSLYLWIRLARRWWYLLPVLPPYLAVGAIPRAEMSHAVINGCYVVLALLILVPVLLVLRLNQFRGSGWIVTALSFFCVALGFRSVDVAYRVVWLPMGTHWLWHLFGAAAVAALGEWVYRLKWPGEELVQ